MTQNGFSLAAEIGAFNSADLSTHDNEALVQRANMAQAPVREHLHICQVRSYCSFSVLYFKSFKHD